MAKKKQIKKKKFINMEITRVALNQEQAVLSCCEQPGRGANLSPAPPGAVCILGAGCPATTPGGQVAAS